MIRLTNYLAVAGLLLLASCSQKENVKTVAKNNVISVKTEQPVRYTGKIQSGYSGVVEAKKTTALSFATMGTLTEIFVNEGQAVKKGQLLAKVNSANAQNTYQMALAKQQQAIDAYNRMKPMKENGTLPEIKWVEVETGVAQAKSAVSIAKKSVADCNLYAPESGVIGSRNVQPGMNVVPTTTVLTLLNIQSVYVKIPVSENEISRFKKGETAQVTINAIDKTIAGTVKEIGVTADILSHTYPVKIELSNASNDIKPGMICSVKTNTQDKRSGLLVSNKSLQKDIDGNQFVFVEKDGKTEKTTVQVVALIENQVLVKGEISENTNVITSGQQKLNIGTHINVIK